MSVGDMLLAVSVAWDTSLAAVSIPEVSKGAISRAEQLSRGNSRNATPKGYVTSHIRAKCQALPLQTERSRVECKGGRGGYTPKERRALTQNDP